MGRGVLGFGVPTSLFLAILVLALANSSRSVWGISGSKRMPCGREGRREGGAAGGRAPPRAGPAAKITPRYLWVFFNLQP